ncbi:MAG: lipopolysaccharide assembly protein LapA domain-containing protein [Ruminobacter sp.]|nr:lipopolysaccharide assembly protein LapA domain-containing protein [Ruminobacter sp.]
MFQRIVNFLDLIVFAIVLVIALMIGIGNIAETTVDLIFVKLNTKLSNVIAASMIFGFACCFIVFSLTILKIKLKNKLLVNKLNNEIASLKNDLEKIAKKVEDELNTTQVITQQDDNESHNEVQK